MKPKSLLSILGRGAGLKLGADLFGRLLQYVLLWLAARQLAPGDFGDYSFALAIGYALAQVADFGLQLFVGRELSRLAIPGAKGRPYFSDEAAAARLVGGGLMVRVTLAVPALLLMGGLLMVEPLGNRWALMLLALGMLLAGVLEYFAYCFRALGRLGEEAASQVLARGTNLLLGAGLLIMGGGVWGLAIATNLAMTAGVVFAYWRLRRFVTPAWQIDWAYWRGNALGPTALGLGVIFSMLAFRADNLLIPPLLGREALGVYNAAYKLFEPSLLLPGVVLAATFPLLVRAAGGAGNLRQPLSQTIAILFLLGLGAAGALFALAAPLIALLYGPSYSAATPLLQLLAFACLPMFLNYGLTHALIALDMGRTYAGLMLLALVANVATNLLLLPALGIAGAAMITVATEMALLLLCTAVLARKLSGARKPELAPGSLPGLEKTL